MTKTTLVANITQKGYFSDSIFGQYIAKAAL